MLRELKEMNDIAVTKLLPDHLLIDVNTGFSEHTSFFKKNY